MRNFFFAQLSCLRDTFKNMNPFLPHTLKGSILDKLLWLCAQTELIDMRLNGNWQVQKNENNRGRSRVLHEDQEASMTLLSSMSVCENSVWAPPLDTLGPIVFLTFTVFFPRLKYLVETI